jgi:drug/metabolite transporter (DMT)-like permease
MSEPSPRRPERIWRGIIVMVVTALAMAFGDALVKRFSSDFSVWQIYVARSLVAIPITIALLLAGARPAEIMPKSVGWAFLRSALLVAMWVVFYAALPILSLSVVAASYYTGPLFITLFSALLIGEPIGLRRWVAIFIGLAGVLVILRPGTEAFSWLTVLPILSAALYAMAAIITRTKCADERPLALSLVLNICFLAAGAIATGSIVAWGAPAQADAYPFLLGPWTSMGTRQWVLIMLMAGLVVATSAGVAKAYQSGPPSIIATFDYTYLVFAVLWSFVFFSEAPDVATVIGMLLIAAAGLLAISRARTVWQTRAGDQTIRA